jgi:hypothetical protein
VRYNRKTVSVITPPSGLAVSLTDMKAYLVITGTADDALLTAFIQAATEAAKQYLKRSILEETLELTMDGFNEFDDDRILALGPGVHTASVPYILGGGNEIDLAYPPVKSVTTIKTFDRANTEATFSNTLYQLDGDGGRVYLNESVTWPSDLRARAAVKVRYVVGYTAIPAPIVQGIKQHVAAMYECRDACSMPEVSKSIMASYRLADNLVG